jgi:predicted phosphodiesterase
MKLAVLADIHGNMAALEAVVAHVDRWRPDLVVVAGDIVNRGPYSADALRFVQERQHAAGWQVVRGNHEDYVIAQARPDAPRSGPAFDIFLSSYWTYCQLGCDVAPMEAMPFQVTLTMPDGSEARIAHASMRGTRDGIFPSTPDDVLRKQIGRPVVPLFCVGHTHWPLVRHVDGTLVVNVGAVGMPFDGDPRASYGQLSWAKNQWQAQIVRLDYDRERAQRDFADSGFLEDGGPLARLMLRELRLARSQLYQWALEYETAVLAGALSLEESVERFLRESG